uniref:Odorant-binding protein 4 n=1 Tax=Pyrrhalta maculicollis TaxID=226885 RepID=A0A1J0KKF4_9CUCU|nr:odorant-binding protein 4 [Pyrrhalta maculicollis]
MHCFHKYLRIFVDEIRIVIKARACIIFVLVQILKRFTMHFSVFVLFFVFAVASAEITPEQQAEQFKKIHDKCQSDPATHVDDAVFDKLRRGEKVTEPNLAKHTLCMNVGSGIQSENGDINIEKLRTILERGPANKAKVDEIIGKCGTRSSTNAEEAAEALANCVRQYRPERPEGDHHGPHDHHHHH